MSVIDPPIDLPYLHSLGGTLEVLRVREVLVADESRETVVQAQLNGYGSLIRYCMLSSASLFS